LAVRAALVLGLLLIAVRSAVAEERPLPRPLACYKRYHGLDSERRDGRFYLKLPSGVALLYDDELEKDAATRLERPDVEDQFVDAYRTGALRRETEVDRDPGRVRVTSILRALYGATAAAIEAQLTSIDWFGARLRIHRRAAPALTRVRARIETAIAADPSLRPWLARPGGSYVNRQIAGTDRLSAHAFGIAVDIDPKRTEYWRWDRDFPQGKSGPQFTRPIPPALVAAFEAEGFIWGGRWYHYDTMHFEFRPELLDPTCAR
jgi:hypothetical protein